MTEAATLLQIHLVQLVVLADNHFIRGQLFELVCVSILINLALALICGFFTLLLGLFLLFGVDSRYRGQVLQ